MKLPISVVMCTYNGAQFIAGQVRSVLDQTHCIAELIVVDDASADDTCLVLEALARADDRIQLYRNDRNIGFSANFEKALGLVGCEWIAIADQDDIWHEAKLEKMLAQYDQQSPLMYCDSVRFSETPPVHPQPNKKNRRIDGTDPKKTAMFNTISGHAMILKKGLLAKALPVPGGVYYDWWLAMVAMCNGGVQFIPEILVYQRAHESNVTIQQHLSERELRNQFRVMLEKHLSVFAGIPGMCNADKAFFKQLYMLWHRSRTSKWNWQLFLFLMKHRHEIYYYKVRRFPFVSQLKHSFLFAFRR